MIDTKQPSVRDSLLQALAGVRGQQPQGSIPSWMQQMGAQDGGDPSKINSQDAAVMASLATGALGRPRPQTNVQQAYGDQGGQMQSNPMLADLASGSMGPRPQPNYTRNGGRPAAPIDLSQLGGIPLNTSTSSQASSASYKPLAVNAATPKKKKKYLKTKAEISKQNER